MYGSCMFSFIRNCQTVFQSGRTIFHSHQQHMSDRVSLLTFSVVPIFYFSHSNRYVVIFVVLICLSHMPNDVEHLW